ERQLEQGPWHVSGQTMQRRLDQMPPPIARAAPYPIALASTFELDKNVGASRGTIRFDAVWDEALGESACAAGIRPELHGSLDLEHGISRLALRAIATGKPIGELTADFDTPLDRYRDQN